MKEQLGQFLLTIFSLLGRYGVDQSQMTTYLSSFEISSLDVCLQMLRL